MATEYLGRDCGNQSDKKRHRTFLNLVLRGKLCKFIRFFCEQYSGGVLLPNEKRPLERALRKKLSRQCWKKICPGPPPSSTMEVYDETPIFITVDITEGVVKLVARKLSESLGPSGTDLESLQKQILKLWEDSKNIYISVKSFVDWLANTNPPWSAYCAFMSGLLIEIEKQPIIFPVGVGENWR